MYPFLLVDEKSNHLERILIHTAGYSGAETNHHLYVFVDSNHSTIYHHAQGCKKDRGTLNKCDDGEYKYGFRNRSGKFRTIMSDMCNTDDW